MSKYQNVTPEEFKKGSIYTLFNAFQLHGDTQIMDSLGRNSRAYSLMKLALEEVSKSIMFLELSILKSLTPNHQKVTKLYKEVEDHNSKTEYAFNILLSKQREFFMYHPNTEIRDKWIAQVDEPNELKNLLNRKKELDVKKNTNLYTSLIGTEFKPPFLSVEENDIEDIRDITFQLLVYAKGVILELDASIFESLEIKREDIEKLDAFQEAREIHILQVTYLNNKFKNNSSLV